MNLSHSVVFKAFKGQENHLALVYKLSLETDDALGMLCSCAVQTTDLSRGQGCTWLGRRGMPECLPVGDGWSAGAYTRLPISRRASELAPVTVLLLQMAGTTFEDPRTSHNRRLGRIMGQLRHRINVHSPGINIGASRIPFLFAASNLAPLLY